jgi:hypothetical protein
LDRLYSAIDDYATTKKQDPPTALAAHTRSR